MELPTLSFLAMSSNLDFSVGVTSFQSSPSLLPTSPNAKSGFSFFTCTAPLPQIHGMSKCDVKPCMLQDQPWAARIVKSAAVRIRTDHKHVVCTALTLARARHMAQQYVVHFAAMHS